MTAGRGFPAEASAADGVVRGGWRRYSICTVVTKAAQYGAMVEGFGRHWYGRGEQDASSHDDDTAVETLSLLWARGLGVVVPGSTEGT